MHMMLVPGLWANTAALAGPAAATASVWNPSDLSGVTLSNGNATAAFSGAGVCGVRNDRALPSSKIYAEFHIDLNATADTMFGISEGTPALNGWRYNSGDTKSVMIYNNGLWYNGGTTAHGLGSNTTGRVGQLAIDRSSNLLWVGFDGTFFGNPSAGTGGFNISALIAPLYLIVQGDGGDAVSLNTGGSAYAFTAPTGFGSV